MSTGARFFLPYMTVIDASGVPIPGAKLYFYQSGTSTPLNTYSDVTLLIANQNPVIANAGGRFGNIFLLGQSYKVVLTDSLDNEIWTADPVQTSGAPTTFELTGTGTFLTPLGTSWMRVRMAAGGAGGSGTSNTVGVGGIVDGGAGSDSSFGTTIAKGGLPGTGFNSGGISPSGTGPADWRQAGGAGGAGAEDGASGTQGGFGGNGFFGGGASGAARIAGGQAGGPAPPRSGAGGGGATNSTTAHSGPGGGAGEYLERTITNPDVSYAYANGNSGVPGASSQPGGTGGGGRILVDVYFT